MRRQILCVMAGIVVGFMGIASAALGGREMVTRQTISPMPTGQTYVISLRLLRSQLPGRLMDTTLRKVAIFPFADYSYQQSFVQPLSWGGNRGIVETIADQFIAHGIAVALQEDVDGLLVAQGMMRPIGGQYGARQKTPQEQYRERAGIANTPEFELAWGLHDPGMQEELRTVVASQSYVRGANSALISSDEPALQGVTSALANEKIVEFARTLGADLIIRGRILEYGFKPSRPASAVVQMRMYAQDGKTGELIWSNRGEVEVAVDHHGWRDESDLKALSDRATRELIEALMADFFGER
jgi:hypothetical protein